MAHEKVKAKYAKLLPDQTFSFGNDSKNDHDLELVELYAEETNETASEKTKFENMDIMGTLLEVEDISDAAAGLEEYRQKYDQEDEMAQCVPELVVYDPVASETKPNDVKQRPRTKLTPKRRSSEQVPRLKNKPSKKCMSVSPQSADAESENDDYEFPKAKKEGLWVQCSKNNCLKWRKLPNDIEPSTMPYRWVCSMNPDSSRIECSASQETCDSENEFDVVYTAFVPGSLVWAKVPGYPWWPGMVEDDPDYKCCYETDDSDVNPISYHVSFIFDKNVSRSWVSYLGIRKFEGTENPNETGSKPKKYVKALSRALVQARNAMDLSLAERITKYSFNVLYKAQIGSHTDEKPRKTKKRKQVKTTTESANPKKSNSIKPDRKAKHPSPTESDKSSESAQDVVKKKVNKKKRVLPSSDEGGSGKKTDKSRKTKKRKQVKTSAESSNPKKSNSIKPDGKAKRPSLAESDKSSESTHSVVKKKVNKKKRVLLSSDEDGSEEETAIVDGPTMNTDSSTTLVENGKTEAQNPKKQLNADESVICMEHVPPENAKTDTGEKKSSKNKVKKKTKPAKTNNEVSKNKRKSTRSDEEEKTAQSSRNSTSPSHLKANKRTVNKSDEKGNIKTDTKKSKFVKPLEDKKSKSVLNASNTSESSVESALEKLARNTKSNNAMDGVHSDTTMDSSSMDGITNDTTKHKDTHINDKSDMISDVSLSQNDFEKSGKKSSSLIKKKKTKGTPTTSSEPKVSVVKPKKFELTLAAEKKSKPANGNKVKKIKHIITSPKILAKESQEHNQKQFGVGGTSLNPKCDETTKKTMTVKKAKQSFCKFKAPIKASFKVTPAAKGPGYNANKDEKSKEEAKKTLEEVLDIPSSDDPRTHPEKYVNIGSLEQDISNLYQELSDKAAASTGVMSAEDVENLTEASDCVPMEFLDQQISGNTGNSECINAKQLTDSPEF